MIIQDLMIRTSRWEQQQRSSNATEQLALFAARLLFCMQAQFSQYGLLSILTLPLGLGLGTASPGAVHNVA